MVKWLYLLWGGVGLLMLVGCRSLISSAGPVPFPDELQQRAMALEAQGSLSEALHYWEAASAVAEGRVEMLRALRQDRIEVEFAEAEKAYDAHQVERGEAHLLKVLRLDPFHGKARIMLREARSRHFIVPYTARGGESMAVVAARVYGNERLGSLVSALYGRDAAPGEVLWLPRVDAPLVAAQFNYRKAIRTARRLYAAKEYVSLLDVAEEILSYTPGDGESLYLKNMAAHYLAEGFYNQEAYEKALSMYRRVDAYFRNEKGRIQEILLLQEQRRDAAEKEKNRALLAQTTLRAREGELVVAMELLKQVGRGFEGRADVEQWLAEMMNSEAESHYRRGVAFFLDENLMESIREWEKSLELNPGHVKAREGVANAKRLQERVKGIQWKREGKTP